MAVMNLTKRYHFQAVHSLGAEPYVERLHGHEFSLSVRVQCRPGMRHADRIVNQPDKFISQLDSFLDEHVLARLHGKDLGEIVEPATGENLVIWISEQFEKFEHYREVLDLELQETQKNRFRILLNEARTSRNEDSKN